jgi:hypothetical protein
MTKPYH